MAISIALTAIITPILYGININSSENAENEAATINVWQVDGFEGGTGSRKAFIEKQAKKLFKGESTYVTVTSLTQTAARENLSAGTLPDVISYSPTLCDIERYINPKYPQKCWCYGVYCFFSLDNGADFADINSSNCIINNGKDNLVEVCAATLGLNMCAREETNTAYLKLLNGKFKYLLGTQRDLFRFKSRGAEVYVKAVSEFNDLYQIASVITKDNKKAEYAKRLIDYLADTDVSELGLFSKAAKNSCDTLNKITLPCYDCVLDKPCGKEYLDALTAAAKNGEINKLKNLLK